MGLKKVIQKKVIISAVLILLVAAGTVTYLLFSRRNSDIAYPTAISYGDAIAIQKLKSENPVSESTSQNINEFGYETAAKLFLNDGKNENYSPVSLYYALSLAASGAKNSTQKEMLDVLRFKDSETLSKECGNLYRNLYFDNRFGKLKIANSIWLQKNISFDESFKKNAAENFYASAHNVDFTSPSAAKQASRWIKDHTGGNLSPNLKFDKETLLSIINTVYFKDEWQSKFEKRDTQKHSFHKSDGRDIQCDFLCKQSTDEYYSADDFSRSSLSFRNGGKMVFILPKEGVSVKEFTSDSKKLKEAFEGGDNRDRGITWKVPKFSFGSSYDVNDAIKSLGVKSAFTTDANFSGISSNKPFFLSKIKQQTHIELTEDGVEASAYTVLFLCGSAKPPDEKVDMILDRPFIYGIFSENGTLLFVGVCEDPTKVI